MPLLLITATVLTMLGIAAQVRINRSCSIESHHRLAEAQLQAYE